MVFDFTSLFQNLLQVSDGITHTVIVFGIYTALVMQILKHSIFCPLL